MKSGLKVLPFAGAGGLLLAHLLAATAFHRRTSAMIACLEHASAAEMSKPPVPAIVQCFARRPACGNPVPDTIWLRQSGELRVNLGDPWRPFTAEQVISTHQPGFVWLARMQAAPLISAHPRLLCGRRGSPQARLFGSLRLARCGTT